MFAHKVIFLLAFALTLVCSVPMPQDDGAGISDGGVEVVNNAANRGASAQKYSVGVPRPISSLPLYKILQQSSAQAFGNGVYTLRNVGSGKYLSYSKTGGNYNFYPGSNKSPIEFEVFALTYVLEMGVLTSVVTAQ